MQFASVAWAWTLAHWFFVWPIVSAVASLVYTRLDRYPRVHALLAALAGAGLDLPRILAMVQKAVTGKAGAGGKLGSGAGLDTSSVSTVFVPVPVQTQKVPDAPK